MKKIDIKIKKTDISAPLKEVQYPHFIGSWDIERENLCKEIISLFEDNKKLQKSGVTAGGRNLEVKKTTDIRVSPNDLKDTKFKCLNDYIEELYNCFTDYKNQWPFIKNLGENKELSTLSFYEIPIF